MRCQCRPVNGKMQEKSKIKYRMRPCADSKNIIKICVDEAGEDIAGRIFTLYNRKPVSFQGLQSMLLWTDNFLDALQYPMAATELRSFSEKHGVDTGKE